jgi:hypothetical protein
MPTDRFADSLIAQGVWQWKWQRMLLGKYHRTGDTVDGYDPDYRYLVAHSLYSPRKFRSLLAFEQDPPTTEDVPLSEFVGAGLDFYVYMSMGSIRTTYSRIATEDRFSLKTCELPGGALEVRCTVIPPTEAAVPGIPGGDLTLHQYGFGGWGPLRFNLLHLPVFLRVSSDDVAQLLAVFDRIQASTLLLRLIHSFPRKEKLARQVVGGSSYVSRTATDEYFAAEIPGFLTVRKSIPSTIRVLVASDIHIAEANDIIENNGIGQPPGTPGVLDNLYCNQNTQARHLVEAARQHWERGEVDYVILNGDIIDYALKDSIDYTINLHPNRGFIEEPRAFRLGSQFFNMRAVALGDDTMTGDDWVTEYVQPTLDFAGIGANWGDEVPGPPSFFAGEAQDPDVANWNRVMALFAKLRDDPLASNWGQANKILQPMVDCVPTFLVPGNHDRIVCGYDLAGTSCAKYRAFFDAIAVSIANDAPALTSYKLALARAYSWLDRDAAVQKVKDEVEEEAPACERGEHFAHLGLSAAQARSYDDNVRKLKSNFRTFLGLFHEESALSQINDIPQQPSTGGSSLRGGLGYGSRLVPFSGEQKSGAVRFAFFDDGPNWNLLENPTPWVQGFPAEVGKEPAAISQFRRWREHSDHDKETLIGFLHAPLFSLYGPHNGRHAPGASKLSDAKRPLIFKHGWMEFMKLSMPWVQSLSGITPTEKKRDRPLLLMSGHSHWKHTYSLFGYDAAEQYYYEYGNGLLSSPTDRTGLHEIAEDHGFLGAYDWWHHPQGRRAEGTARTLVLHSGCVGPIPGPDYDEDSRGKVTTGTWYVPPEQAQGYYILTIDQGVVTKIEWKSLWYKDPWPAPG